MAQFRTLEDEIRDTPCIRREDVKAIREWAKKQPHLPDFSKFPEGFIEAMIAMFLKRRYNSIERAKETLDSFYTFRELAPEVCFNKSLRRKDMETAFKMAYTMVMDKRDSEGNIVFLQYLQDPDMSRYDYTSIFRALFMVMESWSFENGSAGSPGITFIFDQTNFSLGHFTAMPLTFIKKLNHFNKNCSPISLKNIYVVNATNFTQTMMAIVKPIMQGELFQKIKLFTSQQMDEFYKFVPKEAIPHELGGTGGTMKDLTMQSVKRIERYEYLFEIYENLHVDESKRHGPQNNVLDVFGLDGSFKKLNVD